MTMEELLDKICLSSEINCCTIEGCKNCSECDSVLREMLTEYTEQVRKEERRKFGFR